MILNFDKVICQSISTADTSAKLYLSILATILITLLGIQNSLAAQAESTEPEQPRWFEVEIILYKANSEVGLVNESWSADTKLVLPEEFIDFLQPYSQQEVLEADGKKNSDSLLISNQSDQTPERTSSSEHAINLDNKQFTSETEIREQLDRIELELESEKPFVLLAESDFQLTEEARRVSKNRHYTLLAHFSWRQPVLGRRDSQPIRIAGGIDFQEAFDYAGTEKTKYPEQKTSELDSKNTGEEDKLHPLDTNSIPSSTPITKQLDNESTSIVTNSNGMLNDRADLTQSQQEFVPVALPWVPEIDGSMLVYIQRNYLHVDASLFYRRPDKEEVNPLDLTKSMLSLSDNYSPLSEATQEIFQQPRTITAPLTAGIISADQNNSLLDLSDTKGISEESIISDSNNIAANDYQNNGFGWEFNQDFLQSESEKIYITRLFNYPLKQTRRLRSGELHYFDHPLIGMLVMIRPYKRVLEDELESTDAQVSAVKITDAKQYMSHSTK